MRKYTDLYYKAWQAGAVPVMLVFMSSSMATYCFGKQTPTEAMVGTFNSVYIGDEQVFIGAHEVAIASGDVFDWSARVLTFGDFRESLSTNNDDIFESFHQKELASYTVILDNADQYFTKLSGQEEFLGHQCLLYQGFDYPNFAFGDFLSIFNGKISNFEPDTKTCFVRAAQAIETVSPDSPVLNVTRWYSQANAGAGNTVAEGTVGSTVFGDVFGNQDSWDVVMEFEKDSVGVAEELFEIENNDFGTTRLLIGINASNQPYIKFSVDARRVTPEYATYTATTMGFGAQAYDKLGVRILSNGTIHFWDAAGNSETQTLDTGNVFIADSYIRLPFKPHGLARDSSGNLWITANIIDYLYKYSAAGEQLAIYGGPGTADGKFSNPLGIAIDAADNVFVVDSDNNRVQKFNSSGVFQGKTTYGMSSPKDVAVAPSDGDVFVSDGNVRIVRFNSSLVQQNNFCSAGTGDDQCGYPRGITHDGSENLYILDQGNNRIIYYDNTDTWGGVVTAVDAEDGRGIYIDGGGLFFSNSDYWLTEITIGGSYRRKHGYEGTGILQFGEPEGVVGDGAGNIWVADFGNSRIMKLTTANVYDRPDLTPMDGETIRIGKNLSGAMASVKWQPFNTVPTLLLRDKEGFNPHMTDIVDGNNITLVDGVPEAFGDFSADTSTAESEEPLSFDSELTLPTSSLYTNPGAYASNVPLPLVYGDMTENSTGAAWVCVCIDSVAFVYCVAGWPILSVANGNTVTVYVDDVLTPTGWVFNESNDYEGQGTIATLDFTSDPGGVVTVKCKGKDIAGVLITNPINVLEDLLEYAATQIANLDWDRNDSSFAQAKAFATSQSYTCAGVILADNSINYWIQTILKSFMGAYRFDQNGYLYIQLLPTTFTENIFGEINEYDAIQLRAKKDIENICNHVIINYARSSVEVDRRYKQNTLNSYNVTSETSDATSIAKYKSERIQSFDFDWTRNTATVEKIRDAILDLYKDARWLVTYIGQDFNFMLPDMHDQIRATLSLVRDSDNVPVQNGVYALREKVVDLDKFTTRLVLYSIGLDQTDYEVYIGTHTVYIGAEQVYIGGA